MTVVIKFIAPVVALIAIGAGFLFTVFVNIGGGACDVYCGPGSMFLPLALVSIAIIGWLVAIGLAIAGLFQSRGRSIAAWAAILLSFAMPVALTVLYIRSHS